MRQLAILGRDRSLHGAVPGTDGTITLADVAVRFAMLEVPEPRFDPEAPENASRVLIRVLAFSLNYRDQALMLTMTRVGRPTGYYVIGSDFVGDIVAVGPDVVDLRPGDRVINDNAFPDRERAGVSPGIPTNHASKEFLILDRSQVMRVPAGLPLEVLAAFSISAQTAYAMIRRTGVTEGERVLLTAPRSNTSLFVMAALSSRSIEAVGLARSAENRAALLAAGYSDILVEPCPDDPTQAHDTRISRSVRDAFDVMIDPLSDIYMTQAPDFLAQSGRYVSCGIHDQHSKILGRSPNNSSIQSAFFAHAIAKNATFVMNCLGQTRDLATALDDAAQHRWAIPLGSVYSCEGTSAFIERTFCDRRRVGKVVMSYCAHGSKPEYT